MTASSWDDGERFVHLGNVTEFNEQFLARRSATTPASAGGRTASTMPTSRCSTALSRRRPSYRTTSTGPGSRSWSGSSTGSPLRSTAGSLRTPACRKRVLDRPALLARIRSDWGPVLAWGLTSQFEALLAGTAELGPPSAALAATRHFESKAATHHLFGVLAVGVFGIVPAQRPVDSVRATVRALAARVAAGETAVLKAEHGVGGGGHRGNHSAVGRRGRWCPGLGPPDAAAGLVPAARLALLRWGIDGRVGPGPGPGSDRHGQFSERRGDSLGARHVGGEFVVSSAEVLHEGVSRDGHLCGAVCL